MGAVYQASSLALKQHLQLSRTHLYTELYSIRGQEDGPMQETCCGSNDLPCPLRGFKAGLKMEPCRADGPQQHNQGHNAPGLHMKEHFKCAA